MNEEAGRVGKACVKQPTSLFQMETPVLRYRQREDF
jgi:hypothetical protein